MTPTSRAPTDDPDRRVQRRLLAVLTVVVVVAALRTSATVTLPLAFGVFLVALFWPLQRRLQERMPRSLATLLTFLAFLAVTGAFGWALWETSEIVADRAPRYEPELRRLVDQVQAFLQARGVDPGATGGGAEGVLGGVARTLGRTTFAFLGGSVLAVAYFVLGLLEVLDFETKVRHASGPGGSREWADPAKRIASDFQRYMVVRTGVGLISGVGSGLAAWAVGLDMALVWGVLAFLLNYMPTLGSLVAVVPPVLFGLLQGGWTTGLLALGALGGVQLVTGNTIDPVLQGRYLRLSPLVVLFSVAFWGWVWGIPGAFIGVPITVGITIACAHSSRTRWIAVLLSDVDEDEEAALPPVAESG